MYEKFPDIASMCQQQRMVLVGLGTLKVLKSFYDYKDLVMPKVDLEKSGPPVQF